MRKYTFDEVKMSHAGMLRAKERLISKAQAAASRQGVIGKAEFAFFVAALFLYEIWFSLIVYAHLTVKRVLPGKRMTKIAIIALTVMVFFGIAAFASGSRNNSEAGAAVSGAGDDAEAVDEIASLQKAKAEAAEEALTQEKAEAEAAEEAASIEETTVTEDDEASFNEEAHDEETDEALEENASEDKVTSKEVKATDNTKVAATKNMVAATENVTDGSASAVNETEAENATDDASEEADAENEADKLTKLKEENSDFYGWITSEDAGIDSAIMSLSSRPDKYFDKNFDGKRDKNGLPSIVDEVRGDLSSIIIYAGNVDGNGKFAGILKYADGDCNGTIRIDTLDGSREFSIITGFAESEEAKENEALKHIGDDAKTGDCFLVLVTGTPEGRRFYIVAKSL